VLAGSSVYRGFAIQRLFNDRRESLILIARER
jgi:hypothetical protein